MELVPCWDNHFHLDPAGLGPKAVKEFKKAGGTGLTLVHKPYHQVPVRKSEQYRESFQVTLDLAEKARAEGVEVKTVIAPHPSELTELMKEGVTLGEASSVLRGGLDIAAALVREGKADGFGEVGRPHYPVSPEVWAESNSILSYSMQLAKELGVPVILHTEEATPDVFKELAGMAAKVGLSLDRVVKHFSGPAIRPEENHGIFPSVIASRDALSKVLEFKGSGRLRFAMETDYIDDPRRPGAVLGHLTVPKRMRWLLQEKMMTPEDAAVVHGDNIRMIYGN